MKYKPNQSGTFSNRTSIHNSENDEKLFVLEFYDALDEKDRADIVRKVCALDEVIEALQDAVKAYKLKGWASNYPPLIKAQQAINKALVEKP